MNLACKETIQLHKPMEVRPHTSKDNEIIKEWRDGWNKETIGFEDVISETGIIVEGEEMQAAGFLFETNSKRCWLDMVIVNPYLPKEDRERAINTLIDALIEKAKTKGFIIIEFMVTIPKLEKRFIERGFVNLGNCTYMARQLNG